MAFFWSLCHQLWWSGEKGRGGIPICLSFSHHPHSDEIDNERILLQYLSKVKQFSIIWNWKSSGPQRYGKYQNESNNIKNESDPDMRFVKNFAPPDFQAINFTPLISPNFNSFGDKNTKNE